MQVHQLTYGHLVFCFMPYFVEDFLSKEQMIKSSIAISANKIFQFLITCQDRPGSFWSESFIKTQTSAHQSRTYCVILGFNSQREIRKWWVQKVYPLLAISNSYLVSISPTATESLVWTRPWTASAVELQAWTTAPWTHKERWPSISKARIKGIKCMLQR